MAAIDPSYDGIIEIVATWPAHRRFSLVQDVLRTLQSEIEPSRRTSNTLNEALGLLATDKPAPTDQEIDEWIQQHRLAKHG